MYLSDIFEQLSYGELSQLYIGGVTEGGIQETNYPPLLAHVNLALTELHKRFKLKESTITQAITPGQKTYTITEPLLLQIINVRTESGEFFTFNNEYSDLYVTRPDFNTIIIPETNANTDSSFSILAQLNHPKIEVDLLDPETEEVDIPQVLLDPLLNFIAARTYLAMDSEQSPKYQEYLARYEAACKRVERMNVLDQYSGLSTKLEDNGWV